MRLPDKMLRGFTLFISVCSLLSNIVRSYSNYHIRRAVVSDVPEISHLSIDVFYGSPEETSSIKNSTLGANDAGWIDRTQQRFAFPLPLKLAALRSLDRFVTRDRVKEGTGSGGLPAHVYVAVDGSGSEERLIGCVEVGLRRDRSAVVRPTITNLCVRSDARRGGVGLRLLHTCEDRVVAWAEAWKDAQDERRIADLRRQIRRFGGNVEETATTTTTTTATTAAKSKSKPNDSSDKFVNDRRDEKEPLPSSVSSVPGVFVWDEDIASTEEYSSGTRSKDEVKMMSSQYNYGDYSWLRSPSGSVDMSAVVLTVYEDNPSALSFYKKRGYFENSRGMGTRFTTNGFFLGTESFPRIELKKWIEVSKNNETMSMSDEMIDQGDL